MAHAIPGKATFDFDGYELLVAFEPYRPDIVEEIKGQIPQASREWDAAAKVWRVSFVFKATIEEIFDVFDYSIRDFTGKDSASRIRQARLKAEKDDKREQARARADQENAARQKREAEREKAREQARARARQSTGTNNTDKNRRTQEEQFSYTDYVEQLKWAHRFREVWPDCDERDFKMWWSLYLIGGREYANRQFSDIWNKRNGFYSKNSSPNRRKTLDPYEVLGIINTATCTEESVKAAYRSLAMQWHPDRNQGSAESVQKMKEINAAYDEVREREGWK